MTDPASEYSLPGVLHFLQAEWRRFERERNEWTIERAEFKARIALLEGERRGVENLRMDLMKRVKMLEYALRQERKRHLGTAKTPMVNNNVDSPNTPSSPAITHTTTTTNTTNTAAADPTLALSLEAKSMSDTRSREKSQDVLKSCLQEINYLLSMPTKFPLSHTPSETSSRTSSVRRVTKPTSSPTLHATNTTQNHTGARNHPKPTSIPKPPTKSTNSLLPRAASGTPTNNPVMTPIPLSHPKRVPTILMAAEDRSTDTFDDGSDLSSSSPPRTSDSPPSETEDGPLPQVDEVGMIDNYNDQGSEDNEALSKQVQEAYNVSEEKVQKVLKNATRTMKRVGSPPERSVDLLGLETDTYALEETKQPKIWKTKMSIKGHLDSVRAVCCHPSEMVVASGSDDFTVKVWNLQKATGDDGSGMKKVLHEEADASMTYRGHTSVVTAVAISAEQNRVYSSSMDSTIRVWQLPPEGHSSFAAVDPSMNIATYIGHTDAIWDFKLFPVAREETCILASASADGTLKIWDTQATDSLLKSTWNYDGMVTENSPNRDGRIVPTSLDFCPTDLSKMIVSYSNAKIKVFDIETGQVVMTLRGSDTSFDGTLATQINCTTAHPTLPLVVSGHEDRLIKLYDLKSGKLMIGKKNLMTLSLGDCAFSMSAHLDAVSCLDIEPSGMTLVSGGHDASIRLWDISMTKSCVQEFSAHRRKGDEGVLSVQYHRSMPWMVSGGADGIVKVYHQGHS
ncbi:WD40-repeat-containing domain protein [Phycomyces nitens]|nr:WD40-repeat-containing domain protein [Phycomyces nitens]